MATRATKNNILAGSFVVLTIAAAVWGVYLLSNVQVERRTDYVVRFKLEEGATFLQRGSQVRIGGQPAGEVTSVTYDLGGDGAPRSVLVGMAIRSELRLFKDAAVQLEVPLLGSVSTINIPYVGSPAAGVLEPSGELPGQLAPPLFLAQAGYGAEQQKQMQRILGGADRIVQKIESQLGEIDKFIGPGGENLRQATEDIRAIVAQARSDYENLWRGRVTTVMERADSITAKAEELAEDGRVTVKGVREAVERNRPGVDRIVDNADATMARVNTEIAPAAQSAVQKADDGVGRFRDLMREGLEFVAENRPAIEIALANFRLASDQLRLTMIEVRRNPWRLLYQPTRKELEQELLYDSARAYAGAMSDLRAASAAIESALAAASASGRPVDSEQLQALLERVQTAEAKYRAVGDALMQRIVRESP